MRTLAYTPTGTHAHCPHQPPRTSPTALVAPFCATVSPGCSCTSSSMATAVGGLAEEEEGRGRVNGGGGNGWTARGEGQGAACGLVEGRQAMHLAVVGRRGHASRGQARSASIRTPPGPRLESVTAGQVAVPWNCSEPTAMCQSSTDPYGRAQATPHACRVRT